MKKVLIISYFFPPCNLTASQRTMGWAKYLHKYGYFPIIITRKWEKTIKLFKDCHYETSKKILIENHKTFEVHYCPYTPNLRDKLHVNNKLYFIKKILSLIEIIFQNIWLKFCPYKNIYDYSSNILKTEKEIKSIIISGNPFIQFKFGHKLNKKHNIPWIADYRDAWTTSTINNISGSKIKSLLNSYNEIFEKKWIKSAYKVTASSKPIGDSISILTGRNHKEIYNGYNSEDFINYENIKPNEKFFQIAYVGTLYEGQKIELFLNSFKKFCEKKTKIKIIFPGLLINKSQAARVKKILLGYEKYYELSSRVPRNKILEIEKKSHILLHVAWEGHQGIIASKIYEYIGAKRKILICPGDKSSIDFIVKKSGNGIICNNQKEIFEFLSNEYTLWTQNSSFELKENDKSKYFSRDQQTKYLSQILNSL